MRHTASSSIELSPAGGLRWTVRAGAALRLLATLGVLGALAVAVHRTPGPAVAWADLRGWLSSSPPEDVLLATARLTALVAVGGVLLLSALYLVAVAAHLPRAASVVGRFVPSAIPRAVDGVAASAVSACLVLGSPAGAQSADQPSAEVLAPPAYVPVPAGDGPAAGAAAPGSSVFLELNSEVPPPEHTGEVPPVTRRAAKVGQPVVEHVVEPGEHLWGIAERHLSARLGRVPTVQELVPFWLKVCEANRLSLLSGDPNLIYPGEVILLHGA
jgi:nucleoid-associated protein YgaU